MELRRMAIINLCFEAKRIIESVIGRDDFTYLLEMPDDDKQIVFPVDYQEGLNYKMPVCVVDADFFEMEPVEIGGSFWDIAHVTIDIICVTKAESMDIAETILKNLVSNHNFYDFNADADIPDINEPFDPGLLPSTVLTQWDVTSEEDFSQSTLKLTNSTEPNYAKRYQSTLAGTIRYIRN